MPVNKKGGKKFKRIKKDSSDNEVTKIIYPENEGIEQSFATVIDPLGSRRFRVKLNPPLNYESIKDFDIAKYIEPKMGHLRGKIRRNTWVRRGDIVLVSIRSFEKDKVDIILKYTDDQEKKIKSQGLMMVVDNIENDNMHGFEWDTSKHVDNDIIKDISILNIDNKEIDINDI